MEDLRPDPLEDAPDRPPRGKIGVRAVPADLERVHPLQDDPRRERRLEDRVVPDEQMDGVAALDEEGQPASRMHFVGVAEVGEAHGGIGHGGHGRGDNSSEIASAKMEAG